MDSNELRRRQLAVIEVTGRPGWHVVRAIAEGTVTLMERNAIDEEDEAKGASLRREAKAARKFLNQFLQQVEIATRVEVPEDAPSPNEDYDVAMD